MIPLPSVIKILGAKMIMMLNDQPISHIPNTTILETNRQNPNIMARFKPLIYVHSMEKLIMQRKLILTSLIPSMTKFYMMMLLMNGQIKLMRTL
jgi:hypothetical protein